MTILAVPFLAGLLLGQSPISVVAAPSPYGLAQHFDSLSKDFGNVPHGSQSVHRFTLTNNTGGDLTLVGVRSSCVCATPRALNNSAKPGEKIVIEVTYDAKKFLGERSMTITADFSGQSYEQVLLRVRGFSRQDVILEPGRIELGVVKPKQEHVQTMRLEYAGVLDWRIGKILPGRWTSAEVIEKERSNGTVRYDVIVKVSKDAPRGSLVDVVQLKTNDPSSPVVQIDVSGQIEGGLTASPNLVNFGAVSMGQKATQRLMVKNDHPFSIVGARFDASGFFVKSTTGDRTVHMVEIDYTPAKAGPLKSAIHLRADPGGEELSVEVAGTVQ